MGVAKLKKEYSKPGIIIEEFRISQNISDSCGVPGGGTSTGRPRYADRFNCAWDVNGWLVFTEGNNKCVNDQYGKDEPYGDLCYNNPVAGHSVFASY